MDETDAEKTAFTTPWGTYYYRVMPFGLKNMGATYMRAMTTIFHDIMIKEVEVYVDDVIIKSKTRVDHVYNLSKFFERLRKYNLKLNPAKCAFGVSSEKLLGFIINRRGIELDPSKVKSIRELPPPKNKTEVMSFLGRLNYISRFITQLSTTCEPIFKFLKKDAAIQWTDECQESFDKIKEYLANPLVLVPSEPGQHDITGKKEQAVYYLSKKFTSYEEAERIMNEVHSGVCGSHMNGYVLDKKIMWAGYYWLTMERDYFCFVRKCHQCQIHSDLIHSPPSKLHPMSVSWPFVAWGMDVIDPIEPKDYNGYRFILSIITDNATNLNSHLMKEVCEQFKIVHHHYSPYNPKANGAIEAANKNVNKILREMVQGSRQWYEKLPFALLGYRTTILTSTGATPYLLVYGTEAVIPAEVEIPSLRIISEAEIDDTK
ncbi:uncharacterized protein LOC124898779 [Capsicum annuum]|uniref:uncharacterized protein LOC124898779 n=1 Tax=Capsicum annuum TaxID=4072 RepID=UPI001FB08D6C|nr:uncharacterized protein LOC124898779 [Capsicum annuum]